MYSLAVGPKNKSDSRQGSAVCFLRVESPRANEHESFSPASGRAVDPSLSSSLLSLRRPRTLRLEPASHSALQHRTA